MIKLPVPKKYFGLDTESDFTYFTGAQMRDYAADVSAADNAKLREVVESAAAADEFKDSPGAMDRLAEYARAALKTAEAALSDIGDADREPGDDLKWCEARAAQALPAVRAALKATP
jgi:hypothetical protein